jgi:hypothetical protein
VYNGAAWVATSPTTLGYVETTGPQNGIQSTLVDLTGLTTAITVLANRRIEVAASVNFNKISSDVATWVQLNVVGLPGGITAEAYSDCPAPGNLHIYSSRMATPAAGTYTIKAQAATGAGFVNAHASNRWLRVIDWGPV